MSAALQLCFCLNERPSLLPCQRLSTEHDSQLDIDGQGIELFMATAVVQLAGWHDEPSVHMQATPI